MTGNSEFDDLSLSRGGPFFELQKRLHLLREDRPLISARAAMFVGLAWGVPFL